MKVRRTTERQYKNNIEEITGILMDEYLKSIFDQSEQESISLVSVKEPTICLILLKYSNASYLT